MDERTAKFWTEIHRQEETKYAEGHDAGLLLGLLVGIPSGLVAGVIVALRIAGRI